jgi:hypothetical protein
LRVKIKGKVSKSSSEVLYTVEQFYYIVHHTSIVIICSVKKNVSNIFYLSIEFKGNVHVVRTQEEERLKDHYTV